MASKKPAKRGAARFRDAHNQPHAAVLRDHIDNANRTADSGPTVEEFEASTAKFENLKGDALTAFLDVKKEYEARKLQKTSVELQDTCQRISDLLNATGFLASLHVENHATEKQATFFHIIQECKGREKEIFDEVGDQIELHMSKAKHQHDVMKEIEQWFKDLLADKQMEKEFAHEMAAIKARTIDAEVGDSNIQHTLVHIDHTTQKLKDIAYLLALSSSSGVKIVDGPPPKEDQVTLLIPTESEREFRFHFTLFLDDELMLKDPNIQNMAQQYLKGLIFYGSAAKHRNRAEKRKLIKLTMKQLETLYNFITRLRGVILKDEAEIKALRGRVENQTTQLEQFFREKELYKLRTTELEDAEKRWAQQQQKMVEERHDLEKALLDAKHQLETECKVEPSSECKTGHSDEPKTEPSEQPNRVPTEPNRVNGGEPSSTSVVSIQGADETGRNSIGVQVQLVAEAGGVHKQVHKAVPAPSLFMQDNQCPVRESTDVAVQSSVNRLERRSSSITSTSQSEESIVQAVSKRAPKREKVESPLAHSSPLANEQSKDVILDMECPETEHLQRYLEQANNEKAQALQQVHEYETIILERERTITKMGENIETLEAVVAANDTPKLARTTSINREMLFINGSCQTDDQTSTDSKKELAALKHIMAEFPETISKLLLENDVVLDINPFPQTLMDTWNTASAIREIRHDFSDYYGKLTSLLDQAMADLKDGQKRAIEYLMNRTADEMEGAVDGSDSNEELRRVRVKLRERVLELEIDNAQLHDNLRKVTDLLHESRAQCHSESEGLEVELHQTRGEADRLKEMNWQLADVLGKLQSEVASLLPGRKSITEIGELLKAAEEINPHKTAEEDEAQHLRTDMRGIPGDLLTSTHRKSPDADRLDPSDTRGSFSNRSPPHSSARSKQKSASISAEGTSRQRVRAGSLTRQSLAQLRRESLRSHHPNGTENRRYSATSRYMSPVQRHLHGHQSPHLEAASSIKVTAVHNKGVQTDESISPAIIQGGKRTPTEADQHPHGAGQRHLNQHVHSDGQNDSAHSRSRHKVKTDHPPNHDPHPGHSYVAAVGGRSKHETARDETTPHSHIHAAHAPDSRRASPDGFVPHLIGKGNTQQEKNHSHRTNDRLTPDRIGPVEPQPSEPFLDRNAHFISHPPRHVSHADQGHTESTHGRVLSPGSHSRQSPMNNQLRSSPGAQHDARPGFDPASGPQLDIAAGLKHERYSDRERDLARTINHLLEEEDEKAGYVTQQPVNDYQPHLSQQVQLPSGVSGPINQQDLHRYPANPTSRAIGQSSNLRTNQNKAQREYLSHPVHDIKPVVSQLMSTNLPQAVPAAGTRERSYMDPKQPTAGTDSQPSESKGIPTTSGQRNIVNEEARYQGELKTENDFTAPTTPGHGSSAKEPSQSQPASYHKTAPRPIDARQRGPTYYPERNTGVASFAHSQLRKTPDADISQRLYMHSQPVSTPDQLLRMRSPPKDDSKAASERLIVYGLRGNVPGNQDLHETDQLMNAFEAGLTINEEDVDLLRGQDPVKFSRMSPDEHSKAAAALLMSVERNLRDHMRIIRQSKTGISLSATGVSLLPNAPLGTLQQNIPKTGTSRPELDPVYSPTDQPAQLRIQGHGVGELEALGSGFNTPEKSAPQTPSDGRSSTATPEMALLSDDLHKIHLAQHHLEMMSSKLERLGPQENMEAQDDVAKNSRNVPGNNMPVKQESADTLRREARYLKTGINKLLRKFNQAPTEVSEEIPKPLDRDPDSPIIDILKVQKLPKKVPHPQTDDRHRRKQLVNGIDETISKLASATRQTQRDDTSEAYKTGRTIRPDSQIEEYHQQRRMIEPRAEVFSNNSPELLAIVGGRLGIDEPDVQLAKELHIHQNQHRQDVVFSPDREDGQHNVRVPRTAGGRHTLTLAQMKPDSITNKLKILHDEREAMALRHAGNQNLHSTVLTHRGEEVFEGPVGLPRSDMDIIGKPLQEPLAVSTVAWNIQRSVADCTTKDCPTIPLDAGE